jgi:hypothetical protein
VRVAETMMSRRIPVWPLPPASASALSTPLRSHPRDDAARALRLTRLDYLLFAQHFKSRPNGPRFSARNASPMGHGRLHRQSDPRQLGPAARVGYFLGACHVARCRVTGIRTNSAREHLINTYLS